MEKLKREVGRPPAKWMIDLIQLKIVEDKQMTREELAELLNTSESAIKNFSRRSQLSGEYKRGDQSVKVYYSLKLFKKAIMQYLYGN